MINCTTLHQLFNSKAVVQNLLLTVALNIYQRW